MSEQPTEGELYELRSLLLNGEPEHILNPITPEAISQVLPAAIIEAQRQNPQLLTSSVITTVENAIHDSVHQDRNILSESLFPVIGPSTRKSISSAIGELIQSLNQTLEYSLSLRSFKWRLEARRTGKSFAEVVLLRTLIYQVEQVFFIHNETGLLLQQVSAETAATKDPDLISAMMTAIQDFVSDSFVLPEGDNALGVLEVGELSVWIEDGPLATIACVIRGVAPESLHTTMQETLERLHQLFDAPLRFFDGDAAVFEASTPYLQDCFQSQFTRKTEDEKTPFVIAKKQKVIGSLLTGICLFGLIGWLTLNRQAYIQWTDYVESLNSEPGIVVLSQQRSGGRYELRGLRDPLSQDPLAILESTRIDADQVEMEWQPYLSLDKAFIEHRLLALLNPPPTVSMRLSESGVLELRGTAPTAWIQWAKEVCDRTAGIEGWDGRLLIPVEWPSQSGEIDRRTLYFNAD